MSIDTLPPPTTAVPSPGATEELEDLLRSRGPDRDRRWRMWAHQLTGATTTTAADLVDLWKTVVDFDPVLHGHLADPIDLGSGTVLVAGSGKETLKTFNVSTAAAVLAASAGARVVKGISASVSAVSGSADVLRTLGIEPVKSVDEIRCAVDEVGIAFVPYAMFCPRYAAEYDDVFSEVNPFSFMMPIAVLAMSAGSFVYGIADRRVGLSAHVISACRPDLPHGSVIMTEPQPGWIIDESVPYGRARHALAGGGSVSVQEATYPDAPPHWVRAVAHGSDHDANAARLTASLAPRNSGPSCDLVETNAALIWWESTGRLGSLTDARRHVHEARVSGRAHNLLISLQERGL